MLLDNLNIHKATFLGFLLFISFLIGCDKSSEKVLQPIILETDKFGIVHIQPIMVDTIVAPRNARAQQGILTHPNGYYYFTENKIVDNKWVSTIYQLNSDLSKNISSFSITGADLPLWGGTGDYWSHMGQANYNPVDGFIYVSFMDTKTWKTALLQFSTDLVFNRFFDMSHLTNYLDAIDFQDNLFWYDRGVLENFNFQRFKEGFDKKNIFLKRYDIDHTVMFVSQGIQVLDNKLYYVPENDKENSRTLPNYRGLAVFDIPTLKERINFDVEGELKNYPKKLFRFQIPLEAADHEAMDFILGSKEEFYISTAEDGGKKIYKIRID